MLDELITIGEAAKFLGVREDIVGIWRVRYERW